VSSLNGILLVDKPEGLTSAEVVRRVKKTFSVDKIGHLGTLDPFASGLLPLCLGTGTKIAQFLVAERKAYSGTIRLGVETETLDRTGAITRTASVSGCEPEVLRDLKQRFCGEYWQMPPMYSALKRQGIPLYKLARRGEVVEREPRKVLIEGFTLTSMSEDTLAFSLTCSKGTYIRVLAADLGAALGCGAHLLSLRRTAFGPFSIHQGIPLSCLDNTEKRKILPLLPLAQALLHYRALTISLPAVEQLRRGQQEILHTLPAAEAVHETVRLLTPEGELVAMAAWQSDRWRLVRVL